MATTHYLWDRLENNVIGEFDGGGNVVASYVTKPDLFGDVMSQRRADSGARYYHKDALGTVTELTDQAGNTTDTFRATAFGETAESTGSTLSPFKYVGSSGYYADSGLDSLTVRRRRYSPNTARWLIADPLSRTISSEWRTRSTRQVWQFTGLNDLSPLHILMHSYTYVRNRPTIAVDPSGLADLEEQGSMFGCCVTYCGSVSLCRDVANRLNKEATATSLSDAERFVDKYMEHCIVCANSKKYRKWLLKSYANALRHVYWMALITIDYGSDTAKCIGDCKDPTPSTPDSAIDIWNNPVGIAIGKGCIEFFSNDDGSEMYDTLIRDCIRWKFEDQRLGIPNNCATLLTDNPAGIAILENDPRLLPVTPPTRPTRPTHPPNFFMSPWTLR